MCALLLLWDFSGKPADLIERLRAYSDLKKATALVSGDDIAGFRNAGAPFVQRLLALARRADIIGSLPERLRW